MNDNNKINEPRIINKIVKKKKEIKIRKKKIAKRTEYSTIFDPNIITYDYNSTGCTRTMFSNYPSNSYSKNAAKKNCDS